MPETPEERCPIQTAYWKDGWHYVVVNGLIRACDWSGHDAPPQPLPPQRKDPWLKREDPWQPAPGGFEEALALSHGTGHPGYFDSCERCKAVRAAHAAEVEEAREELSALRINQEESDECSAELFALICAVLDGKPDAVEARTKLTAHVEHVRACRKGSCDTELHSSRRVQEARAAGVAEGRREMAREAIAKGRELGGWGGIPFRAWLESQSREEE